MRSLLLLLTALLLVSGSIGAGEASSPLRALLVIGGCCHDYALQKDILKKGLEKRIHVTVDIAYSADATTKPALPILGDPHYAKGYDVVIHDECAADIADPTLIRAVLAPHQAGVPGVNLHCAMHSYRIGPPEEPAAAGSERALWFEFLGLQSSRHGPQLPIEIEWTNPDHPILQGLTAWTTGKEELYDTIQLLPTAKPLANGRQIVRGREVNSVVAWTNLYRGTRVFSTTIGHNTETVSDDRYLDLVARGLLWACGRLGDAKQPQVTMEPGRNDTK